MRHTDMVNATKIAHDNRQMMLPFEFTPANDADAIDDPFAICRWEDDGGPVGRENADAE
jgi:hypothetical protein